MPIWIFAFAVFSALASSLFVAMGVLWLRRFRSKITRALIESATQQLHTAQKLTEAVTLVQKQQRAYEQQLHNLAQASLKLRQELITVAHRLDNGDELPGDRTVH